MVLVIFLFLWFSFLLFFVACFFPYFLLYISYCFCSFFAYHFRLYVFCFVFVSFGLFVRFSSSWFPSLLLSPLPSCSIPSALSLSLAHFLFLLPVSAFPPFLNLSSLPFSPAFSPHPLFTPSSFPFPLPFSSLLYPKNQLFPHSFFNPFLS